MELLEKEQLLSRNKKTIEIIMEQIKEKCPDSIDMIAIKLVLAYLNYYLQKRKNKYNKLIEQL